MTVPESRIRKLVDGDTRPDGSFVLYWMISARRLQYNFALQRAVEHANQLGRPLLILEPLRVGYTFASARFHRFVIDGMRDHDALIRERDQRPSHLRGDADAYAQGDGVTYMPYVEPDSGSGKGLLATLAERAAAVVTDDHPGFHYPAMLDAAARQVGTCFEAVDTNGLYPMRSTDHIFHRAYDFRRHLQKTIRPHLAEMPDADPLDALTATDAADVPRAIARRWRAPDRALLDGDAEALAQLPIDHNVEPVDLPGGCVAGTERLEAFLRSQLSVYADERNHPDLTATSGLSPYLHFGHVGAHQVFAGIVEQEGWDPSRLSPESKGARAEWWGMSVDAEAYIDQLMTWRELGFNGCVTRDDVTSYRSLPDWARKTLREHASDRRTHLYTLEQFESADTHEPLWNAAQNQLLRDGIIHNYLRMLWGKMILAWSSDPRKALSIMLHLNDKYAIDGRDPNSLSGIFWTLGRYDRAWGPERPVFGKIRYMTPQNTRRKLKLQDYLAKYGGGSESSLFE